jgi:arsenate reductase
MEEPLMALPGPGDGLLLLHNPRCSKSRATHALLEERGATFAVREYLSEPLSEAELDELATRLGKPFSEFVRSGEAVYKETGLAGSGEDALRAAIAAHPILMERPVLVSAENAAIGRPPENVLELL